MLNLFKDNATGKLYQFVKYFVRRHCQLFIFVILSVAMPATVAERFHRFQKNFILIRPPWREFLCVEGIFYRGKRTTRAFASPYQIVAPGMSFDLFNLVCFEILLRPFFLRIQWPWKYSIPVCICVPSFCENQLSDIPQRILVMCHVSLNAKHHPFSSHCRIQKIQQQLQLRNWMNCNFQ